MRAVCADEFRLPRREGRTHRHVSEAADLLPHRLALCPCLAASRERHVPAPLSAPGCRQDRGLAPRGYASGPRCVVVAPHRGPRGDRLATAPAGRHAHRLRRPRRTRDRLHRLPERSALHRAGHRCLGRFGPQPVAHAPLVCARRRHVDAFRSEAIRGRQRGVDSSAAGLDGRSVRGDAKSSRCRAACWQQLPTASNADIRGIGSGHQLARHAQLASRLVLPTVAR
mmetsp:Transcript_31790/g.91583  ORF Transcript_31790/g.91583 Transcript_31790/m.91583 type:complete len:226 (-) Transcript_31790:3102-3779(-)